MVPLLVVPFLGLRCLQSQQGRGASLETTVPQDGASVSSRYARPAPERLVAIGDLHGDLDVTRRALRLAGAIDDKDAWGLQG